MSDIFGDALRQDFALSIACKHRVLMNNYRKYFPKQKTVSNNIYVHQGVGLF